MAIAELKGGKVPIKLWTPIEAVESSALDQLRNVARLPWAVHHVAVMPDVHYGKGATVGSVIAMRDAVSPAAVGVDIGCGMAAMRTNLPASRLPDSLTRIRGAIEAAIPVGFEAHDTPLGKDLADPLRQQVRDLLGRFRDLAPEVRDLEGKAARQLGTLGGGNHFIELCVASPGDHGRERHDDRERRDDRPNDDRVWLVLHSGSRNIGKVLAELHIARAKKLAHNQELPDRDLSVFLAGTKEMNAYRHDLYWAQAYALLNRTAMLAVLESTLRPFFPDVVFDAPVLCHHNYVAEEVHFGEKLFVTRKGAIRAGRGQLGIIPGSMGSRSYVVRGLGNPESFESASHGAGRRMSRGAAKRQFSVADLRAQTAGVECRKDPGVIDEIPGAYKDIDEVMRNQRDLVEVVAALKQVLCVKG